MSQQNHGNDKKSVHHVTPLSVYYNVWVALLVLTVVTVATSYMNFGSLNIIVAMAIATVKAVLVTTYFMGLKYDSEENNYTFYSAFVFLLIFILLTGSDLFYRKPQAFAPVVKDMVVLPGGGGAGGSIETMLKTTPELVAKGKGIYTAQCVSCHGAEGKGDGAAAAAMNPKPRNFTATEGWKNGRSTAAVFKTLTNGLPGTSMPAFGSLESAERLAIAHYVRSLMTNPPADTDADVAALKEMGGAQGSPKLPLDFIMEKMAQPESK